MASAVGTERTLINPSEFSDQGDVCSVSTGGDLLYAYKTPFALFLMTASDEFEGILHHMAKKAMAINVFDQISI